MRRVWKKTKTTIYNWRAPTESSLEIVTLIQNQIY